MSLWLESLQKVRALRVRRADFHQQIYRGVLKGLGFRGLKPIKTLIESVQKTFNPEQSMEKCKQIS